MVSTCQIARTAMLRLIFENYELEWPDKWFLKAMNLDDQMTHAPGPAWDSNDHLVLGTGTSFDADSLPGRAQPPSCQDSHHYQSQPARNWTCVQCTRSITNAFYARTLWWPSSICFFVEEEVITESVDEDDETGFKLESVNHLVVVVVELHNRDLLGSRSKQIRHLWNKF